MRPARLLAIWLCLALACLTGPAHAVDLAETEATLDRQTGEITRIAVELTQPDADLSRLRDRLSAQRARALELRDRLAEDQARLEEALARLGEPVDGEADQVTARRDALQAERAEIGSALARADINIEEANRLLESISSQRRATFYSHMLERTASPLQPAQLGEAAATVERGARAAWTEARAWVSDRQAEERLWVTLAGIAAALALGLAMTWPVRTWISNTVSSRIERLTPSPSRRILAAAARTASRAVPAILGGVGLVAVLQLLGILDASSTPLVNRILAAFVAAVLVDGAAVALLSPKAPRWRVIDISGHAATGLRSLFVLAAVIVGLDGVLSEGALRFGGSETLTSVQRGLVASLLGAILILATRPVFWRPEDNQSRSPAPAVRSVLGLAGLAAILAALVGYTALAHFVTTRFAYALGLLAVAWLARAVLREAARTLLRRLGMRPARDMPDDEDDEDGPLLLSVHLLGDALVALAVLPPLLLLFGASWSDVRALASDALTGFEVGSVRISILEILLAAGVVIALIAATRLVQRTAERSLFRRMRLDVGVQTSLKTLIGYVGMVIAFMTGIGMLGFDLSNLAIIAGALSVGIGFGLQSIVNNFVSGLILLFERPIKVGDWIFTSSGNGIVKKISVRSTEIETFDRTAIIIPNADLISNPVTNWTHRDKLGRITVPVGVSYNEDPDRILELLRAAAESTEIVLSEPPPLVLFRGFGDSSLDFEVRAYLQDIATALQAQTDLLRAIFATFREHGVEIPFPQRDLHLRTAGSDFRAFFGGKPDHAVDVEAVEPPETPADDQGQTQGPGRAGDT